MNTPKNTPTENARKLRKNATESERMLWRRLSARKIAGIRFNRQVPVGPFICDFVSRGIGLVIEVDGGHHSDDAEREQHRTVYLESCGLHVIRFWNNDVMHNIEGVVSDIERVIQTMPSPSPSRKREGSN